MVFAVCAILASSQGQLAQLQEMRSIMPGQRELVVGATPYRDCVHSIIVSKQVPAKFDGSSIGGASWIEYSKGYVRWSVTDDVLEGKPCRVVKQEGFTKEQVRNKQYVYQLNRIWWLDTNGKILRQHEDEITPFTMRQADCSYGADAINVKLTLNGSESRYEYVPVNGLEKANALFQPMMAGDKVLLQEKEVEVLNPFLRRTTTLKVKRFAAFRGTYMNIPFSGQSFEIHEGTSRKLAYVSVDGDLPRVDLAGSTFIVPNSLPQGKEKADPEMKKRWVVPAGLSQPKAKTGIGN